MCSCNSRNSLENINYTFLRIGSSCGKDCGINVSSPRVSPVVDYFYIAPAKRAAAAFLSEKVPSTLSELGVVFGRAELSLLQTMWKDLGGEKARLAHFLASDHFKACPFLDIQSRLYAALNIFDADRLPEPGDYYDTQIIATAMPHCDVLALDGYMKQLVERIKLDQKYGVKIFSAKKDDFEGFLAFLAEL